MSEKKILLLGGGGHCRSVLDCLMVSQQFDTIGIVDNENLGSVMGVPVIGTDDDLPDLIQAGWDSAFISVGSIGYTQIRRKLYSVAKNLGFALPVIADPSAIIARGVALGEGVFIGKGAVINTGSKVGDCAIINTGAVVEHDCLIGNFTHISPGAILCGQVSAGHDSHIGAGSVIRQGIKIGSDCIIGIGSMVVSDIPNNVKAYGNPCRVVE